MVGCGIDIRFGGFDEVDYDRVVELGGLYVVGIGCYYIEWLDNQLCGWVGCQGDFGLLVFFLSWEDDVVVVNFDYNKLLMVIDENGWIVSLRMGSLFDYVQCVVEGWLLDVYVNMWCYNQLIVQQCVIIVEWCNMLLCIVIVCEEFVELVFKWYEELFDKVFEECFEMICWQIMLYYFDCGWVDYLVYLVDIWESIYLCVLGWQNLFDEFYWMVVDVFVLLVVDVIEVV